MIKKIIFLVSIATWVVSCKEFQKNTNEPVTTKNLSELDTTNKKEMNLIKDTIVENKRLNTIADYLKNYDVEILKYKISLNLNYKPVIYVQLKNNGKIPLTYLEIYVDPINQASF